MSARRSIGSLGTPASRDGFGRKVLRAESQKMMLHSAFLQFDPKPSQTIQTKIQTNSSLKALKFTGLRFSRSPAGQWPALDACLAKTTGPMALEAFPLFFKELGFAG